MDESFLVRQIFRWRAEGFDARAISGKLNTVGHTKRGRRWSASSVHQLLYNEAMIGYIVFNRRDRFKEV